MKTPNLKKDLKDELAELKKPLEAISNKLDELNNLCEDMCPVDELYSNLTADLKKEQKLTKKQAKEKARAELKAKMPDFVNLLESIDLVVIGMGNRIQETVSAIEHISDLVCEVENAKDNIEAEINDL